MAENQGDTLDDLLFADEDRLRHEIKYLRERLVNLEVFKKMFFTLQEDLVVERNKTRDLKQELSSRGVSDAQSRPPAESGSPGEDVSQLKNDLKNATEMAMLSMTTASEYGAVMDFFKESGKAASHQDLVMLLFQAIASYGLESSVQIRSVEGDLFYAQNESTRDEDLSLINRFKIQGRILEREGYICINFKKISMLIKNFPFDDEEKTGRFKDYLVVMCSGAEVRIDSLDNAVQLMRQRRGLFKIVKSSQAALSKIEKGVGEQIRKTDNIYTQLANEISGTIKQLGLAEDQQHELLAVLAKNKKQLSKVLVESLSLDGDFVDLIEKLERTYSASKLGSKMEDKK